METSEGLIESGSTPGPGTDLQELAEKKAAFREALINDGEQRFFATITVPDWVTNVMDNNSLLGLPPSPQVVDVVAVWKGTGWGHDYNDVGPLYKRLQIIEMLDVEFKAGHNTTDSLWTKVPKEVLVLCGIASPATEPIYALGPEIVPNQIYAIKGNRFNAPPINAKTIDNAGREYVMYGRGTAKSTGIMFSRYWVHVDHPLAKLI